LKELWGLRHGCAEWPNAVNALPSGVFALGWQKSHNRLKKSLFFDCKKQKKMTGAQKPRYK